MTHRIEQFKAKVKLKQLTDKRAFITIKAFLDSISVIKLQLGLYRNDL